MCVAQTAKRARRNAKKGYPQISPRRRPRYHREDATKSAQRNARLKAGRNFSK